MASSVGVMWFTNFMDTEIVVARLMKKTEVDPTTGCHLWTGAKTTAGYGEIMVDRRPWYTHRLSHVIHIGPIPEGYVVDHVWDRGCRSKACWFPGHLEAVTQRTNIVDRGYSSTSAINARKTHCVNGHEFTPDNTLFIQNSRRCIACVKIRVLRYRDKKNANRRAARKRDK
jgi:hypothetical protein